MSESQQKNLEWLNTADKYESEYKWLSMLLNNVTADIATFGGRSLNTSCHSVNRIILTMKNILSECDSIEDGKTAIDRIQHELIELDKRNFDLMKRDPEWGQ